MKKISTLVLTALLCLTVFAACKDDHVPQPASNTNSTPTSPAQKLTEDEAITIALEHAKLTRDAVSRLHAEYELDDGIATWEVEFDKDRTEYSYEIHAETGVILSYETDLD